MKTMKHILWIFSALFCSIAFAQSPNFLVKWKFENVVEGYNHSNKMQVYIDGKFVAESAVFLESDWGEVKVAVSKGSHAVKIVNYSLYEGNWEEHTLANNYSVDGIIEEEHTFKKKNTLTIVFDIDTEQRSVLWDQKASKAKKSKGKTVDLVTNWQFLNVLDGYDHEGKMQVYIDGKLIGTSSVFKESNLGTFTYKIPKGKHEIRFIVLVNYEGKWEEHLKTNDYSVDAEKIETREFKTNVSAKLTFDIDTETATIVW